MRKNIMFKRFLTLVLLSAFVFTTGIEIKANESKTKYTNHVTLVGDAITGSLWAGVDYSRMHVEAERVGSHLSTDAGLIYSWDAISVVAENNPAIKVASWGLSPAREGYKQGTTSQIAEDYEKTHPGYTVLAAINGDFFANTQFTTSKGTKIGPTFEPINTWVADGGITYKKTVLATPHHCVVGFRLDRTYTYHIGSEYTSEGVPIDDGSTFDKNGENIPQFTDTLMAMINDVEVEAYVTNGNLREEGVNVVLPGTYNIDTTGYSVVKCNIDRYTRANDGFQGKYFIGHNYPGHAYNMNYTGLYLTGRSYDATPKTGITITEVPDNNFYIITKEDSIKNEIELKARVTVQYNLTGDTWGNVNSTIGTVMPFLIEGNRTYCVSNIDNYLNDQKPKSVIAFTKNNDAIFFFMGPGPLSGSRDKGPSSIEMCEILEKLGAVNAFCLDGGGSATIVIRNSQGGFTELNSPTDYAGTRSIGNALLMIIENSNLTVKEAKSTSVTFHQEAPMAESTLVSATVHVNNKAYELEDGEVEVTGLKKNTSYEYYFEYTYENNGVTYSTRTNTETVTTLSADVHEHEFVDGKCSCGAVDPDYEEHVHEFVDGECECGEVDPDYEEHVHEFVDGECECGEVDPDYEEHVHEFVDGECECGEVDPDYEKHEHKECPECGKCTAADCDGKASEKCAGHQAASKNSCAMGTAIISPIILAGALMFVLKKKR